jgi:hypothetical protein
VIVANGFTRRRSARLNCQRRAILDSTVVISTVAKLPPMQLRRPRPNGM